MNAQCVYCFKVYDDKYAHLPVSNIVTILSPVAMPETAPAPIPLPTPDIVFDNERDAAQLLV